MVKTFKQVADSAVKYFDDTLAQVERDFHLNDKRIEDMTDDEYRQWLEEAVIAEQKAQAAIDEMFEAWFEAHRTTVNAINRQLLKQGANQ